MPPTERPLRAVFFDAGNTLLQMNYTVIAAELMRHGVRVAAGGSAAGGVAGARPAGRGRLRARHAGRLHESRSSAGRYLRYVLEGLGVADAATIEQVPNGGARTTFRSASGTLPIPRAHDALALVRRGGSGGVISNSNGSVRSILDSLGLTTHLGLRSRFSESGSRSRTRGSSSWP